jgi:hypothetical protein
MARRLVIDATPEYPLFADMQEYWERAVFMADHGTLFPSSWRMPGYPAALAATFHLLGATTLDAARAVNALCGAATAALTFGLARRTAGTGASLAAGLAVALYPSLLVYASIVSTESAVTVPLVGALLAATFPTRAGAVAGGALAAAAALVRPAGVVALPAVLFGLLRPARPWRDVARDGALVAGTFAAVMSGWWLHNARLHGRFIPLDTTGGYNLLVGNAPFATGLWEWRVVQRIEHGIFAGTDWRTPEAADRATALAVAAVAEDPWAALRRVPAKLAGLAGVEGREQAFLYSVGAFGAHGPATVRAWGAAIMLGFPLLTAAALWGVATPGTLVADVRRPALALLGLMLVMHVATFGDPRFHLPAVPVLAVLGTGARPGTIRIASGWVAVVAVVLLGVLWWTGAAPLLRVLPELAAPDGWRRGLALDDLL